MFNRPFDDQTQIRIRLESEAKLYIQAQIKNLGDVDAERFITLVLRELFSYIATLNGL